MLGRTRNDAIIMLECPAPGCNAKRGRDYHEYWAHLMHHHTPEDFGLTNGTDTIQTRLIADGGPQ